MINSTLLAVGNIQTEGEVTDRSDGTGEYARGCCLTPDLPPTVEVQRIRAICDRTIGKFVSRSRVKLTTSDDLPFRKIVAVPFAYR